MSTVATRAGTVDAALASRAYDTLSRVHDMAQAAWEARDESTDSAGELAEDILDQTEEFFGTTAFASLPDSALMREVKRRGLI